MTQPSESSLAAVKAAWPFCSGSTDSYDPIKDCDECLRCKTCVVIALLLDQQLAQARAEERQRLIVVFVQWLNDVAPIKGNGERASGLIERIKALP